MDRTHQRLSALSVSRATKEGYLADGGGLYLQLTAAGTRSWIYRYSLDSKRREMGLGPFPAISLAAARASASEARALVKGGRDPIDAREAKRAALRLREAEGITFDEASKQFISTNKGAWRTRSIRISGRTRLLPTPRHHWRIAGGCGWRQGGRIHP